MTCAAAPEGAANNATQNAATTGLYEDIDSDSFVVISCYVPDITQGPVCLLPAERARKYSASTQAASALNRASARRLQPSLPIVTE